jgi:hypothetical protein
MSAAERLTRKQEAAALALLTERTNAEAARAARVSEATLQRWLRLPQFRQACRDLRRQAVEAAVGRLQDCVQQAVDALLGALKAPRESDRIRAAALILEHAGKGLERWDLEDRLRALEEEIAALQLTGPRSR